MDTKRIGILGGTFNPVHNGHLALAKSALERGGLEKIIFIPTALPPHKSSRELITASDRMEMLRRAVGGHPALEVSDIELKRGGKSYTVDTLRQLREVLGPEAEFYLIIGADNLLEIADWREVEKLVRECRFIIITRPGFSLDKLSGENARWANKIIEKDGSNIIELSLPASSSEIRERIGRGENVGNSVPEGVLDYIREKGLYRG